MKRANDVSSTVHLDFNAMPKGGPFAQVQSARHAVIRVDEDALRRSSEILEAKLANFGIVVGIALLLSGIGFSVLTLGGALRRRPGSAEAKAPTPRTVATVS